MSAPTPYTEANAILAAQDGDTFELSAIIASMTQYERDKLEAACFTLIRALRNS